MTLSTEIVNLAIVEIGNNIVLNDVNTDTSPLAVNIRAIYSHKLRLCLSRMKPVFARTRAQLNLDVSTPPNFYGYAYAYSLPFDFLCLMDQDSEPYYSQTVSKNGTPQPSWVLERGKIFADIGELFYLKYIRYEENSEYYDAEFTEFFVKTLAEGIIFSTYLDERKLQAFNQRQEISQLKALSGDSSNKPVQFNSPGIWQLSQKI